MMTLMLGKGGMVVTRVFNIVFLFSSSFALTRVGIWKL
jgi:hypothetical protein